MQCTFYPSAAIWQALALGAPVAKERHVHSHGAPRGVRAGGSGVRRAAALGARLRGASRCGCAGPRAGQARPRGFAAVRADVGRWIREDQTLTSEAVAERCIDEVGKAYEKKVANEDFSLLLANGHILGLRIEQV